MISSNKILTLKNYHILSNKYFPQDLMNDESSNTWFDKQQFFSLKYILDDHVLTRCFGFQVKRNLYRRIIRLVGRDTGKWRGGVNQWPKRSPLGNPLVYVYSILEYREDMIIWQQQSACVLFNKFSIVTIEKQQRIGLCNLCFIIDSVPLVNI